MKTVKTTCLYRPSDTDAAVDLLTTTRVRLRTSRAITDTSEDVLGDRGPLVLPAPGEPWYDLRLAIGWSTEEILFVEHVLLTQARHHKNHDTARMRGFLSLRERWAELRT